MRFEQEKQQAKKEWISKNLVLEGTVYFSKTDNSRLGPCIFTGNLIEFLVDHGINDIQASNGTASNIGYSQAMDRWFGWTIRAICGFNTKEEAIRFVAAMK